MNIKNLIEHSKSTRDFKGKKVPENLVNEVIDYAKGTQPLFTDEDIQIMYLGDGEWVNETLAGIAGFHGIMIKAPQYFLFLTEDTDLHQINVGYYVQKIVLKIQDLGFNCCWITLPTDGEIVKQALNIHRDGEAASLLAIGYDEDEKKVINRFKWGENYAKSSMKVVENNVSPRRPMTEIVYFGEWGKTEDMDEFAARGIDHIFRYIVMAPSSFNRQPWRFLIVGNRLHLFIEEDEMANDELDLLDAGIVMLYVELLYSEYLVEGTWKVRDDEYVKDGLHLPEGYKYIGYFSPES